MMRAGISGLCELPTTCEDTGERGKFFGRALCVTSGGDNFRGGIRSVEFADGVARLGIGGRCNSAGVDDDDVGNRGSRREIVSLRAKLALDGGGVGLCSTTTELFNVEGRHGVAHV